MKPVLFLVHGMGNHTEASFKSEVVTSLNAALSYYPNPDTTNIESAFDIVVFSYNDIFENYLEKLKNEFGDIITAATSMPELAAINDVVDFKNDLRSINEKVLFTTHWLDVVLYRFTLLGEAIRARFTSQLSQLIRSRGSSNVHIIAHSLGTAVTLDALSILYDKNLLIDPTDGKLNPIVNRLGSVTYLANVAKILEDIVPVDQTVVNPSDTGCSNRVFNVNHQLDPFTKVRPYKPTGALWTQLTNIDDELEHLATKFPHDVGNYLKNPVVNQPLFEVYFNSPNYSEGVDIAQRQFLANNKLVAASEEVIQLIEALKQPDGNDWQRFYSAFKAVYQLIKE